MPPKIQPRLRKLGSELPVFLPDVCVVDILSVVWRGIRNVEYVRNHNNVNIKEDNYEMLLCMS